MNAPIISQPRQIKAIETSYKGHKFRSRLEARWGIFFDALGLNWEYEPEGFDLPGGVRYLPDFRVVAPQGTVSWYEVKPSGNKDCEKMAAFAKAAEEEKLQGGRPFEAEDIWTVYQTLSGDPYSILIDGDKVNICPRCATIASAHYGHFVDSDGELNHGCGPCDVLKGEIDGVLAPSYDHKGMQVVEKEHYPLYLARIQAAATAARSARFEHGHSGATI